MHYYDDRPPDDHFRSLPHVRKETFRELFECSVSAYNKAGHIHAKLYYPGEGISNRTVQTNSWKYIMSLPPAFSVVKTTVIEAVQDIVNTLFDLRHQYVKLPTTEAETAECIATFNQTAPKVDPVDFFNRYQQHDIIVQGITDGTGKFTDAVVGIPGSLRDARVLGNTSVYHSAEQGDVLQVPKITIDGQEIRPYLVGDSAYPQAPWLTKPYPEGTNDPEEISFNKELNRAQVTVERAFDMLKGRWRVLQKRLDSSLSFAVKTTIACVVLHNFCLEANDEWDSDNDDDSDNDSNDEDGGVLHDGDEIRDLLKDFICGNV